MMTTTKTKWLVTIILAVVMALSAITGVTLYKASADEESDTEPQTATIVLAETRYQAATGLVYFSFATDAKFTTPILSLHGNDIYADYIYLNDEKLVGSAPFPGIHGENAIHMNWSVGESIVPELVKGGQHWAIGLKADKLKTGDKLIIKKGLSVPYGEDEGGEPVFVTLDRDYEFVYDGSDPSYPNFGEYASDLVFGTVVHDGNNYYLRAGFNVPFSAPEASVHTYAYYRENVLLDGESPRWLGDPENVEQVEDYIHKNLWGDTLCLRPNTTYIYFAANGAKEVTLKEGMYVAGGKRLDKDYVFTLNEETNTWMVNQPVSLYSEDEKITTYTDSLSSFDVHFNGFVTDERKSMESYFPTLASGIKYNGTPITQFTGDDKIYVHANFTGYANNGYKTTWKICVPVTLLAKASEGTTPTITIEKGTVTESGVLNKTYNFIYDKNASSTESWSLAKEVIESFVPCDKDGNEVTLESISTGIGKTLDLPKYAKAELNSGVSQIFDLSWSDESFATGGEKTVTCSLIYNEDKYEITSGGLEPLFVSVTVAESIDSIAAIEDINTTYGTEVALPSKVTATMTDDSTVDLAITWADVTDNKFTPDAAKDYTLNGVADAGGRYYSDGVDFNVTVKISAAKVKITVTANDATIKQGETLPYFTYEITSGSMVGTDTLETKANLHANSVADGKTAGEFEITVSGTSANYDITFVSGTLTVKEVKAGCGSVASVNGGTAILCVIVSLCAIALVKNKKISFKR